MKTYTREEAEQLGYKVIKASAFEVGLVKTGPQGDKGVRTWWNKDFDKMPDLGHPKILEAVSVTEDLIKGPTLLDAKWLDPECWDGCQSLVFKHNAQRMREEHKNLLDIYSRAATTLGMQPEDNFHGLDQLASRIEETLSDIRVRADYWLNTRDTSSLRQAMREFVEYYRPA